MTTTIFWKEKKEDGDDIRFRWETMVVLLLTLVVFVGLPIAAATSRWVLPDRWRACTSAAIALL